MANCKALTGSAVKGFNRFCAAATLNNFRFTVFMWLISQRHDCRSC